MSNASNVDRVRSVTWIMLSLFCALLLALTGSDCQAGAFPDSGLDIFQTSAVFRVISLDGTVDSSSAVYDPWTYIGRSNPQCDHYDAVEPQIAGGGSALFPNTHPSGFGCRLPLDFPYSSLCRRWVSTEILNLNLTDGSGMFSIKAGQAYWNSSPNHVFFRNSFGIVSSREHNWPPGDCCIPEIDGGTLDTTMDFPADSYFDVYVEVSLGPWKFYNLQPMCVQKKRMNQFPPILGLPQASYIHDPTFQAVPLYDDDEVQWGYLLSAGHGGDTSGASASGLSAPLMISSTDPVLFTVDSLMSGLPASLSPLNHVRDDAGSASQPVTVYQTSGLWPGAGPDLTNIRVPASTGSFAASDAINSFSFGRDGTIDPLLEEPSQKAAVYF